METQQVLEYLKSIPRLHSGGCLISAYAFYLHEKKMGRAENLQIVVLDRRESGRGIQNNTKFLNGQKRKADSSAHFGWTYDGGETVWDANGDAASFYCTKVVVPKELTDKFCLSSLNYGGWNWSFDRAGHTPKIAERLSIDLSKIFLHYGKDTSDGWSSGGTFRKRPKLTSDSEIVQLRLG